MDIENDFSLEDIFSQLDTDQEKQKSERIPFKFLDSYTKTDNDIFFGREEEINDVFRKFHVSKLLLIYGRSGTGKSSIINCGLLNRLPSEDIYPITIRCSKNPYEEFRQDIRKQRKKLILKHKSNDENYSFYIRLLAKVFLNHICINKTSN
jgi:ABC-type transport system involved in cytochrome bd biosynthesis fused ATPase/permease subunit